MPHRQFSLLPINGKHGINHVWNLFGMDDCHKRMGRPVRIPKRECSIIHKSLVPVHEFVRSSIAAVGIAEQRRCNHRMVQGGIENPLSALIVRAYPDF